MIATLTGAGSFAFRLGGQRFRGAAVPLTEYFAWEALQAEVGTLEHLAWYVPLLAERLQPGKVPVAIDAEWVGQHVRVQHLDALDAALLEEINPGDAFDTEGRALALGKVKILAGSYTLAEFTNYRHLLKEHGGKKRELPMDLRLEEAARALRVRYRSGLNDSAEITSDWLLEHLTVPALRAFERLLFTGRAPGEPDPEATEAQGKS